LIEGISFLVKIVDNLIENNTTKIWQFVDYSYLYYVRGPQLTKTTNPSYKNKMKNEMNQWYYETQEKLEYIMKNVLTLKLGKGYEDKLSYTYEDWDMFSSLPSSKVYISNPLWSKVFLMTYPISGNDITIDLLKELSNNDYTLSDKPFDLGSILLVSSDIQEWYSEISKK
jgi:hypothetical protein